jgi:hypothetical protein
MFRRIPPFLTLLLPCGDQPRLTPPRDQRSLLGDHRHLSGSFGGRPHPARVARRGPFLSGLGDIDGLEFPVPRLTANFVQGVEIHLIYDQGKP